MQPLPLSLVCYSSSLSLRVRAHLSQSTQAFNSLEMVILDLFYKFSITDALNLQKATAVPPTFSIKDTTVSSIQPFVIAAVDLDAPTPQTPTRAQIRHFLGGNFFASDSGDLVNTTAAVSEFRQPTPPAGSDPHR